MNLAPEAEAIFGSVSRGNSDQFSDRDILIVGETYSQLIERQKQLTAEGWSVACYTWSKLQALSDCGALFLQHLKNEAIITKDDNRRLKLQLSQFAPKRSYAKDLVVNASLAQLASVRPSTREGALWAADVLYVATRNFGILRLAEKGNYVFGYETVLNELVEQGVIGERCVTPLRQLRVAKSIYRSGDRISKFTAGKILADATSSFAQIDFPANLVERSPIEILLAATPLKTGSPAYHYLRNLERNYLALCAIDSEQTNKEQFKQLLRWIENPRAYSNLAAFLEPRVQEQIQSSFRMAAGLLVRSAQESAAVEM